jgi:hypothetical protein
MSHKPAWVMTVDRYLDPAYLEKHQLDKWKWALKTAPTHHQGSHNLPAFKRALVSDVIYLL